MRWQWMVVGGVLFLVLVNAFGLRDAVYRQVDPAGYWHDVAEEWEPVVRLYATEVTDCRARLGADGRRRLYRQNYLELKAQGRGHAEAAEEAKRLLAAEVDICRFMAESYREAQHELNTARRHLSDEEDPWVSPFDIQGSDEIQWNDYQGHPVN